VDKPLLLTVIAKNVTQRVKLSAEPVGRRASAAKVASSDPLDGMNDKLRDTVRDFWRGDKLRLSPTRQMVSPRHFSSCYSTLSAILLDPLPDIVKRLFYLSGRGRSPYA